MTLFSGLIKVHCLFIQKDIFHSAFYPRDWDFINSHLDTLYLYLEVCRNKNTSKSNINITALNEKIELLNEKIKTTYVEENINIINIIDNKCNTLTYDIELEYFYDQNQVNQVNLFDIFYWFIYTYNMAKKLTKYKYLPNPLNEYHNAFSHMMPLFYTIHSHPESYEKNIQKTRSHLIRGILDSCKIVIEFKKSYIMGNEELLEEYHDLRKDELSKIGIIDIDNTKTNSSLIIKYIRYIRKVGA